MDDALSELRKIRENNLRVSSRVVALWLSKIDGNLHKLGSEKWTLLEQVFIAALDVSDRDIAQTCLELLRAQFPKSTRVNRLFGMFLEATDKFQEARALYSQIIEEEPTNQVARKRLIAIYKAKGQTTEAIEELNKYLKTFMADSEAWSELADMHLAQGNYRHAAFCIEELILSNPHNHLLHQRLAEIKYTEGGMENMELAKSYFTQACHLNPNNIRALYGLVLATSNLPNKVSTSLPAHSDTSVISACNQKEYCSVRNDHWEVSDELNDKGEHQCLAAWASNRLAELYKDANIATPFSPDEPRQLESFSSSDHASLSLRQRTAGMKELSHKLERLSTTGSSVSKKTQ